MGENLKQRTIKGMSWSMVDNISNAGITFIVGLIIARFITPEEYGLLGIILVFIALFNSIVDSGFSNALIRKKHATEVDYNTIFHVNLLTSVLLYVILYFSSPLISRFFSQPQLVVLLRVTCVIVIINAVTIIQKTILVKKLDFKTQAMASLISSVVSGVVGIIAAVVGLGVWSLVLQQVLRQVLYTLFIWIRSQWSPKRQFSITSLKDLFGFGWKLLVSGLLDTLWNEINQVVIGRYYAISSLGQYTRAKQFSDGITYGFLTAIQRVSFPSMSEVQDDDERFTLALRKILKMSMLLLFPIIIGLAACSESLLEVLIGSQWHDASVYIKYTCFVIMLSPVQIIDLNVLQVKKRSDIVLKLNIIGKVFAILPLFIGAIYSIEAMLITTIVIRTLIIVPLTVLYSTGKFLSYGLLDHVRDLSKTFIAASVMGFCVYCLSFMSVNYFIMLLLQLFTGVIIYVAMCHLLKINEYYEFKLISLDILIKVRNNYIKR